MAAIILILLNSLRFHRSKRVSLVWHFIWVTIFLGVTPWPKADADDLQWPSFLGVGKSVIKESSFQITWGLKQNKAWEKELPGHGQSSPIIFGNQIFLTAVSGDMKDLNHVMKFNLETGSKEWIFSKETIEFGFLWDLILNCLINPILFYIYNVNLFI